MNSARRRLIRTAPVLAAVWLLGACNGLTRDDLSSLYEAAEGMWSKGSDVTLEEAAAVPYASIGLRFGGGSETMLVLASDSNGQLLWTSSLRIAITTRDGRIVETAGFRYNLRGFVSLTDKPDENGERTIRWQGDFPELGLYSVVVTCRSRVAGEDKIVVLGKSIDTRRIEESCNTDSRQLNWSYRNIYWTDPEDGLVWRSIQHVNPELDAIEIETLRPPA